MVFHFMDILIYWVDVLPIDSLVKTNRARLNSAEASFGSKNIEKDVEFSKRKKSLLGVRIRRLAII